MRSHLCRALTFALALLPALALPGAAPPLTTPRTDSVGDELPAGALVRLGTSRYRVEGRPLAVSLSPDGKALFVAQADSVRVLDATTGKELRGFTELAGSGSALSPDGKVLAGRDASGAVCLWDAGSGRELVKLETKVSTANLSLAFSADGKSLAIGPGSARGSAGATVWEVATGKRRSELAASARQTGLALSPDGKVLATWIGAGPGGPRVKGKGKGLAAARAARGEVSRTVQLWDVSTGKEKRQFSATDLPGVQAAAFSPDGKHLALAGGALIAVHEAQTGKQVFLVAARQGSGALLTYSPDGKYLAAATPDGAVQLWRAATGKRLVARDCPARPAPSAPAGPGPGRRGPLAVLGPGPALCFGQGGRILAACVRGQSVCVWEVASGRALSPVGGHTTAVSALAFAADGKSLLSADSERLCVWALPGGKEKRHQALPAAVPTARAYAGLFSPNGRYLLAGGRTGLRLIETATGQEVFELAATINSGVPPAAFSADGAHLAVVETEDRTRDGETVLRIWDVASGRGRSLYRLKYQVSGLALAFSPDGKHLAFGHGPVDDTDNGEMRLVEVSSGKEAWKATLLGPPGRMAFTPDGRWLATTDEPRGARLWDCATGREIGRLEVGDLGPTSNLAFSADGRALAVGTWAKSGQGQVQLWEMASGGLRHVFRGHRGPVNVLSFAPGGRALATGGADTEVLLWGLPGPLAGVSRGKLALAELQAAWRDLESADAAVAYRAIRRLAGAPKSAVPFLRMNVPPASREAAKTIGRLIEELDDDDFEVRERAMRGLERLGGAARPALQRALAARPSLERKRRLEELLERLSGLRGEAALLRPLRAVEALEMMGGAEAQGALSALAKGGPSSALTQEAQRALFRLGGR